MALASDLPGDRVVMIPNAIWYIAGTPKVAVD